MVKPVDIAFVCMNRIPNADEAIANLGQMKFRVFGTAVT